MIESPSESLCSPLELLSSIARQERSDQVRATVRDLQDEAQRFAFVLARNLAEIHAQRYWADWGFPSFRAWQRAECSHVGFRKAEQHIQIYETFGGLNLSPERLGGLPWSKAAIVLGSVTASNLDEVLGDLDLLSTRELKQKYRRSTQQTTSSDLDAPETMPPSPRLRADGWRLPAPQEDEFWTRPCDWEQLCYSRARGKCALLIGPSGCGKSELAYLLAEAVGRALVAFNFGDLSEPRSALLGTTFFDKAKGTFFQVSPFVRAIQTAGSVILLDELTRAGEEGFNIILPLLDRQGYLRLSESEDAPVIRRAPGVTFIATANVGVEYTGTQKLDWALQNRFGAVLHLWYPPVDKEIALLVKRCSGLNPADARKIVTFADRQRALALEGEYVQTISTRMLLEAGDQVADGVSLTNAVRYCVMHHFSAEGGDVSDRAKLGQLWQKVS